MVSFTLKSIPEQLHQMLKERARQNRRSLNSEILVCLETNLQIQSPQSSDVLSRARSLRKKMAVHLTERKLMEFKARGRK